MLNAFFDFIIDHYAIVISFYISFVVTFRVVISIFFYHIYAWAESLPGLLKTVVAISAITYFITLIIFWATPYIFDSHNPNFIFLYFAVILNAATLYILKSGEEWFLFQLLVVSLNIFHLFFTFAIMTPRQFVNRLSDKANGCVISVQCRNFECVKEDAKLKKVISREATVCRNFACSCKKSNNFPLFSSNNK
jgi:hypothetical protein